MIKKESMTHDVLRLAKMLKRPIDVKEVRRVYGYIDRDSKVNRSFEVLFREGLVDIVGENSVIINRAGISRVYDMADPHRKVKDD